MIEHDKLPGVMVESIDDTTTRYHFPPGTRFEVTGLGPDGERLWPMSTEHAADAWGVELSRGTRWVVLPGENRRRAFQRVTS